MESSCHFCFAWFFNKPFKLFLVVLSIIIITNVYFETVQKVGKQEALQDKKKRVHAIQIQNPVFDKKICNASFGYGEMCPPLYTELGGKCFYNKGKLDCPDIRKKAKTPLRSSQLVLTRMLKLFDLIAHAHNITYWITSGTLLGAARHNGFIPWDEDADLQMPLEEYIKLYKCCRNKFPKHMFFQNSKTDRYLRPPPSEEGRFIWHPEIGFYEARWNPRLRDMKSCTRYCLQDGCKWEDGLMIDIFIAEDYLSSKLREGVFPLRYMNFEGFIFPVPNNWKMILSEYYDDYMNDIGGEDNRIPQDDSDPYHSCSELKKRMKKKKKRRKNQRSARS